MRKNSAEHRAISWRKSHSNVATPPARWASVSICSRSRRSVAASRSRRSAVRLVMAAASSIAVDPRTPRNTCRRMRLWWVSAPEKGPSPRTVCQIVIVATLATTSAVTAGPPATAAIMTAGNMTNSSGCVRMPRIWPKLTCATAADPATYSAAAISADADQMSRRSVVRIAGATTMAPSASPNHQSNHSAPNRLHGCTAPAHRVVTPTVALMAVPPSAAMNRNASTSRTESSRALKSRTRCSAHVATTASSGCRLRQSQRSREARQCSRWPGTRRSRSPAKRGRREEGLRGRSRGRPDSGDLLGDERQSESEMRGEQR